MKNQAWHYHDHPHTVIACQLLIPLLLAVSIYPSKHESPSITWTYLTAARGTAHLCHTRYVHVLEASRNFQSSLQCTRQSQLNRNISLFLCLMGKTWKHWSRKKAEREKKGLDVLFRLMDKVSWVFCAACLENSRTGTAFGSSAHYIGWLCPLIGLQNNGVGRAAAEFSRMKTLEPSLHWKERLVDSDSTSIHKIVCVFLSVPQLTAVLTLLPAPVGW